MVNKDFHSVQVPKRPRAFISILSVDANCILLIMCCKHCRLLVRNFSEIHDSQLNLKLNLKASIKRFFYIVRRKKFKGA